ncbi:MAG: hypothetical protein Q7S40_24365, partial [Opitutaceae bacterium]|nr:hypothetical protein [Opitutaceae bacterium]
MNSSCAFAVFTAACASLAVAQTATTPRAGAESESNPTLLSPFEVTTSKDVGYAASNTLAGTRLNSELWETP